MFTLESFFITLLLFFVAHGVTSSLIRLTQEFRALDVDTSAIVDGLIELAFRLGAFGYMLESVITTHPHYTHFQSPVWEAIKGILLSIVSVAYVVFVLIESERLWRLTDLRGRKIYFVAAAQLVVYILLFLAAAL